MTWWQNLRTLWPGALRQQVTRTGLAYSGAIVIVTLAAVLSANNLLFLILAAMLSILAISGFVSKLTLAGLEIDLLLPPHISARRNVRATVRLKNLKRWMPSFSIHVTGAPPSRIATTATSAPAATTALSSSPSSPAAVTLEEPIELRFPTRGRHSERTFQLTTGFPFGFAERRETRHAAPRSHRLSLPRSAPQLPVARRFHSRRDRSLAPRPGSRFLPHPSL